MILWQSVIQGERSVGLLAYVSCGRLFDELRSMHLLDFGFDMLIYVLGEVLVLSLLSHHVLEVAKRV